MTMTIYGTASRVQGICLALFAIPFLLPGANPASETESTKTSHLPLTFEPNRGQADTSVDFVGHTKGFGLLLRQGNAVMVLGPKQPAVQMVPVHSNPRARAEAVDPIAAKSNYFIGNKPGNWRTDIPNYAKVRYHDLYPGVDLVYYGNQKQLEYDFIVQPGSDPHDIAFDLKGTGDIKIMPEGELSVHTNDADLTWHKPVAYQTIAGIRKPVDCAFLSKGNHRMAFTVGSYDKSAPLIIDPVIEYSTFFGGSGVDNIHLQTTLTDTANAIATDPRGNVYITGSTYSTDFPIKNAYQSTPGGYLSVFVSKFNNAGNLFIRHTSAELALPARPPWVTLEMESPWTRPVKLM